MYVNCSPLSFCCINISATVLLLWSSFLCLASSSQGQELSRRRTSNICRDQTDCPRNAFCEKTPGISNGQCVCNYGYIIIAENGRRECYRAANTIGDSCVYQEQCMITLSTESECKFGRCECKTGTHFVERKNTCYKSVRVGDFCSLTNNCLGEGTVCRSGTCQCPYGRHSRFDGLDCIPDVHLGEKCLSDEECVDEDTRCSITCRCKVSHVLNKNADKCLPVAHYIHETCEEDHQCTEIIPNSKCDEKNKTCVCKDGYHEINYVSIIFEDLSVIQQMKLTVSFPFQKCWVSVPLGGICEVDENCASIENTLCFEGRCICSEGLRPVGSVCSSSFILTSSQRVLALILLTYLFITV